MSLNGLYKKGFNDEYKNPHFFLIHWGSQGYFHLWGIKKAAQRGVGNTENKLNQTHENNK